VSAVGGLGVEIEFNVEVDIEEVVAEVGGRGLVAEGTNVWLTGVIGVVSRDSELVAVAVSDVETVETGGKVAEAVEVVATDEVGAATGVAA